MPVSKPAITFVPGAVENAYSDRRGYALEGIVLHIAAGTLAGCDSWFANPAAQAAATFCVGKGGEIHQYYALGVAPFAHGAIEPGYTAAIVDDNKRAIPNYYLIGIEHEGQSGDPVTPAQYDASIRLAAWLFDSAILNSAATGQAIDRKHVLGHRDISPKSRPNCPGFDEAFFARYIADVKRLVAGQPAPAPVVVPSPVVSFRSEYAAELQGVIDAANDDLALADADYARAKARAGMRIDTATKKQKGIA